MPFVRREKYLTTYVYLFFLFLSEMMQGTMPGARRRGRPHTAWMDNIKTWTELPMEESIRMTEDRDGESTSMVWPTLGSRGVTCHPTEVTFPPLPQPKLVYSIKRPRRDARLS